MNKFINKVINAMLMSVLVFFGIAYKTAIVNAEDNSYTVTIPTAITYSNMNVGAVDISNDYTVNVHGDIDASKAVKVTATANPLTTTGGEMLDNVVKQTKTVWAPDEAINTGSDSNDSVTITGTAKVADSYKGTVVYNATLVDNTKKYTIAYNANSGSGSMPNQEYTYNSNQALQQNVFSKETSHFIGWSLNQNTTTIQIFHDDKEYANCTYRKESDPNSQLYADCWSTAINGPFKSGDVYTLDFDAKSDSGTSLLNTYFYGAPNYLSVSDVSNSDGFHDTSRMDGWNTINLISQEYKHYTVKFVLGSNGDATVPKYILFRVFKGGGTLSFKNITVCKIVGSLDYFDGDNVDKITPKPDQTNLYAVWAIPTEWANINGKYYFFDTNHIMKTGWYYDGSYWYYLTTDSDHTLWGDAYPTGSMLANTFVDQNGKRYTFDAYGHCQNP